MHFTPGAFDIVLCHGVLMHVEEPDPLLAGLARVLAPGGLLSLVVRNADALALRAPGWPVTGTRRWPPSTPRTPSTRRPARGCAPTGGRR
ncbi:hypothetical protein GCM10020221_31470 [Streptomyces thioluteus]|uniref:Methyltransferase type 11 domain-containing protein n=1 Tax=Streptomyces thioluteus TaxID=66431 RepID=A0ABN3X2D0_STRTU